MQPDYSLLPHRKNFPTIEELRDRISLEPHYSIQGVIFDCANRIDGIADCSNNLRGNLVRELRLCARKVQAGTLQLASIIKNAGAMNSEGGTPVKVQEEMEDLERENKSLKKCIEVLREQM